MDRTVTGTKSSPTTQQEASAATNSSAHPAPSSPLTKLPADIIDYLWREHLPPSAAVALSLICKDLHGLIFARANARLLRHEDAISERNDLLASLQLERQLASTHWHCHTCAVLHRITSTGPVLDGYLSDHESYGDRHEDTRVRFPGGRYTIDHEDVRLAVNRHLFGSPELPTAGLSLDAFAMECPARYPDDPLPWHESWSAARIINGELYLCCRRTVDARGLSDAALKVELVRRRHGVCAHVSTSIHGQAHLRPLDGWFLTREGAPGKRTPVARAHNNNNEPPQEVVTACEQCPSDHVTTMEQRWEEEDGTNDSEARAQGRRYWRIRITSYYCLGSGRSPEDPKWKAFAGREPGGWVYVPARARFRLGGRVFIQLPGYRRARDFLAYQEGAIRTAWEEAEGSILSNRKRKRESSLSKG